MNKNQTPFIATHPGELIRDELRERQMTQKALALETGIKPSVLCDTIHGKRSISIGVAKALEKALGIPARIWINLQTQYDLDSANIQKRNVESETIIITIPSTDRTLISELSRKFGIILSKLCRFLSI